MRFFKFLVNLPSVVGVGLITAYQFLLSPDHGWLKARFPYGYCRHYPSCSQYTKLAIVKFGLIKGVMLGIIRISKCNPFTEPKVDLV